MTFELTSETKVNLFGIKLFRIRATVDIISKGIKKGDLGGWVDSLLTPSGNARVSGNAWVSGNAQVSGNARVYGDAWESSPLQIQGTQHFLTVCAKGRIQIGCICKTFKEWNKEYKMVGKKAGYTPKQIKEYGLYIKMAIELYK